MIFEKLKALAENKHFVKHVSEQKSGTDNIISYWQLSLFLSQDFVHHFRVLLPEGSSATREGIQQCLDQLDLEPDAYQVGKTMVFTLPSPFQFFSTVKLGVTSVFNVTHCHFLN